MKLRVINCLLTILVASISMLFLDSCREDTILDASIIPAGDTVTIGNDSTMVLTKTYFSDSVITSNEFAGVPIYHAIGHINNDDNYTGRTNASMYMQFVPPSLDYKFPAAPDSAYLVIPYSGFSWGDTNSTLTQTFRVYEVTDSLDKDSIYYNVSYKNIDPVEISDKPAFVNYQSLKDSVSLGKTRATNLLVIKLKTSFVNKIYNESAKTTSALKTYPEFMRFLRGLYIAADSTGMGNALHYFRLDGTTDLNRANITFFYTKDSLQTASFFFNSTYNAHFNRITRHFPAGSRTGALLASTAASDSIVVIQNEPGTMADLKFPFIKNLPKQPINKAELIITEYAFAGDQKETYFPTARLYPLGVDADGKTYNILDRFPLNSTAPLVFMDGTRQSVTLPGTGITVNQYKLNIPREVQKAIVEGRDTLHLRIGGTATFPGAYRLIAAGNTFSNSAMRIKLNIVYSKL